MSLRPFILLLLLCCGYLLVDAKKVKVEDKEYTVSPYPQDCSKFVLCSGGKCSLKSCHATYVFDPVSGTCTHHGRGIVGCDHALPRKARG
ncbi:hypothetical protein KM043_002179 [Ampulex compressa]|nr:hypothetical protein KM043_002179 [Ampulex compressa]